MPSSLRIIHNTYRDSVALMQLSARIAKLEGVQQASVVMATEGNLALLQEAGLLKGQVDASPSDLLAVVQGKEETACQTALEELESALSSIAEPAVGKGPQAIAPRTIQMGILEQPAANLALISTPGEYAAAEALKALRLGLNVMVFSDNVNVADEVLLKEEAERRKLLVMGPDCGTAIVGGIPLAFANVVRRGAVGVIGASGTGIQQVTSLIDQYGLGVSHALGTGGRDLNAEIGGVSMLRAIDELGADAGTRVIVLVSKPPAPEVMEKVLQRARSINKPVVACFLGAPASDIEGGNVVAAATLEDAAAMAATVAQGMRAEVSTPGLPEFMLPPLAPTQRYVRGLYSGGTFCYEATLLLSSSLSDVFSNTPVGRAAGLKNMWHSRGNTLLDLGGDEFTRGRPHPMIDHRLRNERMLQEAADPEVALILFDVVLGYGANSDPATAMLPAIIEAREIAERDGRQIAFVAFICGTERDPQGLARQTTAMQEAGVMLTKSNAQAARTAAAMVSGHD
jgi:succinyl-CoA synthetase alpha subunit